MPVVEQLYCMQQADKPASGGLADVHWLAADIDPASAAEQFFSDHSLSGCTQVFVSAADNYTFKLESYR